MDSGGSSCSDTAEVSRSSLRWCHRLGIEVTIVDADANLTFASVPDAVDDARLRRAQVLAADNELGVVIARELLDVRLAGQARIVRNRFDNQEGANTIQELRNSLRSTTSLKQGSDPRLPASTTRRSKGD
jgi:CRISPR/Cas system-associated endonuclease Cas1